MLADDFEEIEAFTVIDVLRRAEIEVVTAGLVSTVVEGSHKIRAIADKKFSETSDDFDALVLPGGPGHRKLANSQGVLNLIKDFNNKNKIIAAICAAPSVLARAGILEDKRATIYPGMEKELPRPRDSNVVIDKNIITSKGPGTAMEFALELVKILNPQKAGEVKKRLVV